MIIFTWNSCRDRYSPPIPSKIPNNPYNLHKMNLFPNIVPPKIMMPLYINLIISCFFIIFTLHLTLCLHELP